MARKMGCGPTAAFVLVLLIVVLIGSNEAIGYYFTHCEDDFDLINCLMRSAEEDEEEPEEGTVTATGVYTYKGHSVTVTAQIPLAGGAVTGTASGTCEGKLKGTFSGGQNGGISGSMSGVCSPFIVNIPASAEFSGTVNKSGKTVPIGFTGRVPGKEHEGAMTLSYQ